MRDRKSNQSKSTQTETTDSTGSSGQQAPEQESVIKRLQKTHGNRAVQQLLEAEDRSSPEVDDTEIDKQNRHSVQRSQQAAAATGPAGETKVSEPIRDVISSSGQSLDTSIQRMMEEKMGDSFGDVRIHTGAQAAAACESINARAFTVGNHVAFNRGEYDPDSPEGQHVLTHELAHVRQQTGGALSLLSQEDPELEIDPDPALEREAEETAQRVMDAGKLGIQRMQFSDVHVQRMDKNVLTTELQDLQQIIDNGSVSDAAVSKFASHLDGRDVKKLQNAVLNEYKLQEILPIIRKTDGKIGREIRQLSPLRIKQLLQLDDYTQNCVFEIAFDEKLYQNSKLVSNDINVYDLLPKLSEGSINFMNTEMVAKDPNGKIRFLDEKGWGHLFGRHIKGTEYNPTADFTTFFPRGQSVTRGGQQVALPSPQTGIPDNTEIKRIV